MTVFLDAATNTEPISQEVQYIIDANIRKLQQARLDKRKNATLEDVFKGRNPFFLWSTEKPAWELVMNSLDYYLLSVDEILFANFSRELSAFISRLGQQTLEPAVVLELFARDDLPLRTELLDDHFSVYNKLSDQFYEEFCDENRCVDWAKLTRFITECESKEILQEAGDDSG
ncbi:MAG: PmeII family type II restriction endonuclease [Gammaproteobacteria bacterium]|nr:PmeII family type II restriction endonuclease [Gammaproteobacteria bacterium]